MDFYKHPNKTFKDDDRFDLIPHSAKKQLQHSQQLQFRKLEFPKEKDVKKQFHFRAPINKQYNINQVSIDEIVDYIDNSYHSMQEMYGLAGTRLIVFTQSKTAAEKVNYIIHHHNSYDQKTYPILFSQRYTLSEDERNPQHGVYRRIETWSDIWFNIAKCSVWMLIIVYKDYRDLDCLLKPPSEVISCAAFPKDDIMFLEMPSMFMHVLAASQMSRMYIHFICDRSISYYSRLSEYLKNNKVYNLDEYCVQRLDKKILPTLVCETNEREYIPTEQAIFDQRFNQNTAFVSQGRTFWYPTSLLLRSNSFPVWTDVYENNEEERRLVQLNRQLDQLHSNVSDSEE